MYELNIKLHIYHISNITWKLIICFASYFSVALSILSIESPGISDPDIFNILLDSSPMTCLPSTSMLTLKLTGIIRGKVSVHLHLTSPSKHIMVIVPDDITNNCDTGGYEVYRLCLLEAWDATSMHTQFVCDYGLFSSNPVRVMFIVFPYPGNLRLCEVNVQVDWGLGVEGPPKTKFWHLTLAF